MKYQPTGYDVYVYTVLRDASRRPVGFIWTLRTTGHCTADLEFAESLTHDLIRMGIPWQIRNRRGQVVKEWAPEKSR